MNKTQSHDYIVKKLNQYLDNNARALSQEIISKAYLSWFAEWIEAYRLINLETYDKITN